MTPESVTRRDTGRRRQLVPRASDLSVPPQATAISPRKASSMRTGQRNPMVHVSTFLSARSTRRVSAVMVKLASPRGLPRVEWR